MRDFVTFDHGFVAHAIEAHYKDSGSIDVVATSVRLQNQAGKRIDVKNAYSGEQVSFCHLGEPCGDGSIPLLNFRSFNRGSGYARMTLTGVAKGLLDQNITRANIVDVVENGPSFWPRVGAVPYGHLKGLEGALKLLRANPSYQDDGATLSDVIAVASSGALEEAWVSATRNTSQGGLSRKALEALGERYEYKDNLVLDFSKPHVRSALGLGF